MSPRLLSPALVLLCATALHAGEAASPASSQPYQLQRKSSFAAKSEDQRAPFWPIGWVKRKVGVATATQEPMAPRVALDEKAFKVTSILLGSPSLAIVNGRTYSEGEFLRQPRAKGGAATVETKTPFPPGARIRVYRIDDGAVTLQHQEHLITVMLQRPGLNPSKGDELLLEDRP